MNSCVNYPTYFVRCDFCKHHIKEITCKAFPDGIPKDIYGLFPHKKRCPNQQGDYVFEILEEPIEDAFEKKKDGYISNQSLERFKDEYESCKEVDDKFKNRELKRRGFPQWYSLYVKCDFCKYLMEDYTCKAFPDGIPDGIIDKSNTQALLHLGWETSLKCINTFELSELSELKRKAVKGVKRYYKVLKELEDKKLRVESKEINYEVLL